jgi:hypothetical protein
MEMNKIIASITYGLLVIGLFNVFLPKIIVFGLATISASLVWMNTPMEPLVDRILMLLGIFCCLIVKIPLLLGIGLGLMGVRCWRRYNREHPRFI